MNLFIKNFLLEIACFSVFILAFFAFGISANAQEKASINSNTNQAAESPTPEPVQTPIPVSDIVTEVEAASQRLQKISEGLSVSPSVSVIEAEELPQLKEQLDSRIPETSKLLSARPSLETLRTTEREWNELARKIPVWKKDLKAQVTVYDNYLKELERLKEVWQKTLNALGGSAAETASNSAIQTNTNVENSNADINSSQTPTIAEVPPEILEKVRLELALIEKIQKQVQEKRGQLLTLQTRLSKEEIRINETLDSIKKVREEALSNLFVKDSPAIWNAQRRTDSIFGLSQETSESFAEQAISLSDYVKRQSDRFILHGIIFSLLVGLLFWLRRRVRPWVIKEPELQRAFTVFQLPFVSALILSIVLSGWLYPQAPRILSSILGALALIPGIIFLRRILERPFFPILYTLVIFYFVDQLRAVTATLPLISRILFLLEILGAVIFFIWFLRSKRLTDKIPVIHHKTFNTAKKIIPVVLILFAGAFIANVFGFVSLSNVIGNGVLRSAYAALIIYTAVQIIKSLLTFAFRIRPLASLRMMQEHRQMLQRKVFRVIKWIAIIFWGLLTLNLFSIREPIYEYIKSYVTAELVIGSIAVSLSDVFIFAFTVWLAFAISKLIRFILREDVYPRVHLGGGVPYAISTMLHYAILVAGFILAIAALGIDLTKFTILAGAFGVGLGFGLQNIVNNFVSGLILLFERPVKVNDVVQIGLHQGSLKRIGLRASVLRTLDGAEVIVPNGQLISEEVINWTFSDQQRRLDIDFGVAYGTNPRQVIEMVTKAAAENEGILKEPPPRTVFVGFGDNSLNFQLRGWTNKFNEWIGIRSDLALTVHRVLEEAEIEIPFPQRDLHIRGFNEEIIKQIKSNEK